MTEQSAASAETLAVHAGVETNEHLAVVPPVYQTSTFSFDSAEHPAALFVGARDTKP